MNYPNRRMSEDYTTSMAMEDAGLGFGNWFGVNSQQQYQQAPQALEWEQQRTQHGALNQTAFVEESRRATLEGVMSDRDIEALKARNEKRLEEARVKLGARWVLAATRLTP